MRFGATYMAAWLWLVPALISVYWLAGRSRERALKRFASKDALKEISGTFDPGKRKRKNILLVAAVLVTVIALMRPQWGFKWQEVTREGLEIMIALDTSNSMLAEDVKPNRLSRAKLAIMDLVKKLKGDRIGLVVFSGTAFLQCPLTVDYDGFLLSLDDVDVDSIPVGGTSISKAIYKSIESFEGGKSQEKILIVITDGEDLEGGVDAAIQKARAYGVKIFCVGIGSKEGEFIPVNVSGGQKRFLKGPDGNVVKTRLMEEPLQRMALETGGMYVRATGAEFGLDLIYEEKLSKLEKQEFKSRMEKRYNEKFQIPLILAFLLVLCEPLLTDRKKGAGL